MEGLVLMWTMKMPLEDETFQICLLHFQRSLLLAVPLFGRWYRNPTDKKWRRKWQPIFFVGTSENLLALKEAFLFWADKIFHQKTLQ
jgi:hypothetical protein